MMTDGDILVLSTELATFKATLTAQKFTCNFNHKALLKARLAYITLPFDEYQVFLETRNFGVKATLYLEAEMQATVTVLPFDYVIRPILVDDMVS